MSICNFTLLKRSVFVLSFAFVYLITGCTDELPPINNNNNTEQENNNSNEGSHEEINDEKSYHIKSMSIDLEDVSGFIVYENLSDTKSGSTTMKSEHNTQYSLHSIKKDGNHNPTSFYFNIEDNDGKPGDDKIREELTASIQVIPSLVTDLDKYILFSGCIYQVNESNLSDRALETITKFISENSAITENIFIIRKADGALFNISDQQIFTYQGIDTRTNSFVESNHYDTNYTSGVIGIHIPKESYTISNNGNLFVRSGAPSPYRIFKLKDNDNAIDVEQMTQAYSQSFNTFWFTIDSEENIYIYNENNCEIEVYLTNGKYNSIPLEHRPGQPFANIDIKKDENGNNYIFLLDTIYESYVDDNGWQHNRLKNVLLAGRLTNGEFTDIRKEEINFEYELYPDTPPGIVITDTYLASGTRSRRYIGYKNNTFYWHLPYRMTTETDKYQDHYILSFNTETHKWSFQKPSDEINTILSNEYDGLAIGSEIYCFNVNGSKIIVTKANLLDNTVTHYELNVELPSIVSQSYYPYMVHSIPYVAIKGKSTDGGHEVFYTVNLLNGENITHFGIDGRNTVSFFRIN